MDLFDFPEVQGWMLAELVWVQKILESAGRNRTTQHTRWKKKVVSVSSVLCIRPGALQSRLHGLPFKLKPALSSISMSRGRSMGLLRRREVTVSPLLRLGDKRRCVHLDFINTRSSFKVFSLHVVLKRSRSLWPSEHVKPAWAQSRLKAEISRHYSPAPPAAVGQQGPETRNVSLVVLLVNSARRRARACRETVPELYGTHVSPSVGALVGDIYIHLHFDIIIS